MFVSWEMAETALIPERQVLAPRWLCSATPQRFSSSTGRSSRAPVTAGQDKEASPHWHVLQMLFLIFLIGLGTIFKKTSKTKFLD